MASKKKSSDDATPEVETTPAPAAAETTTPALETTPSPPATETAAPAPVATAATGRHYTRGVVAAGAAGLLVAGGLAGFGIGRATGDDDGPQFNRIGQMRPGGPGWDRQDGPRGNRGDQRQNDGEFPPMPRDIQPNTQDGQPPADGSGNDTSGT